MNGEDIHLFIHEDHFLCCMVTTGAGADFSSFTKQSQPSTLAQYPGCTLCSFCFPTKVHSWKHLVLGIILAVKETKLAIFWLYFSDSLALSRLLVLLCTRPSPEGRVSECVVGNCRGLNQSFSSKIFRRQKCCSSHSFSS